MSHTPRFEDHLRSLLEELDSLRRCDPAVTEERVRKKLTTTISDRLVLAKESPIPRCFGLLDDEGQPCGDINSRLHAALLRFVSAAEASTEWRGCTSEGERRALVARDEVRSANGSSLSSYTDSW